MENKFKVGDRVRCINAGGMEEALTAGAEYTVIGRQDNSDPGLVTLSLEGSKWDAFEYRFELVSRPVLDQSDPPSDEDLAKSLREAAKALQDRGFMIESNWEGDIGIKRVTVL